MKRYFFLCGCLAGLLALSACGDEVMETGSGNVRNEAMQNVMGKIVISLPADVRTRSGDGIDDGKNSHDNLHGTVDVNEGHILIFEADKKEYLEGARYKCIKDMTISFSIVEWEKGAVKFSHDENEEDSKYEHHKRYTGYGYFKPEKGKYYRIYAYAYHKEGVIPYWSVGTPSEDEPSVIINGKLLQDKVAAYTADELASISVTQGFPAEESGKTMEIYGGFLLGYNNEPYPYIGATEDDMNYIIGDKAENIKNYGGELKRRTGRLEVILTDMEENGVASASMVIEKYAKEEPVGMEAINFGTYSDYYNPFNKDEMTVTAEITPDENGDIHLSADMFYIKESYVYIDVTYTDGKTRRYQTRSKDTEPIPAGPDAIETQISKNSKITLPPNCWAILRGSYEQLAKSGNLSLEERWDSNYYENNAPLEPEQGGNN